MNATELFHQNGKSAQIYYCGNCKIVASNQISAEKCCKNNICECGKECERQYYTICLDCEKIKQNQRELDRFNAAEKVDEWDGYVFFEGLGWNNGFSESLEELVEYCNDEEIELPDYVWTCNENHFVNINIDDVLNGVLDNAYEDFDFEDLRGMDELKLALDKFNDINYNVISYKLNYKKALVIKKI